MESARFSIDNDNVFYIEHLPGIDGLVKMGITLFVQKEFPGYNDMTLIQYAVAKRKPKTLKFLIEKAKKENLTEDQIIFQKTSNTRVNLLKLAVLFGSKSDFYDSVDNSCLDVILKLCKISDIKTFEKPLIQAISSNNEGAVELLMKRDADFFSPLTENNNDIEDDYALSEMPIMTLIKMNNNIEQMKHIFDDLLPKQKSDAIIKRLANMTVNGKNIFLSLKKYEKACEFITRRIDNNNDTINSIKDDIGKKVDDNSDKKPDQNDDEDQKEKRCVMCGNTAEYIVDGTWRCHEHQYS